jgi:ATP-binding cassette, subfamily B, bacterial
LRVFRQQRSIWWAAAALTVAQLLGLAAPYLVKIAIDDGIAAGRVDVLVGVGVAGVLIYGVMALARFGGTWWAAKAGEQEWELWRNRLFEHVQRLPLQRLKQEQVGDLVARIYGDTYQIKQLATSVLPAALSLLVGVGGAAVILLVIAPQLVALALLPIPVAILVIRWFRTYVRPLSSERMRRYGKLHSHLHEALSGVEDTRALGAEKEMDARVRDAGEAMKATDLALAIHRSRLGPAADFGISLVLLGTLVAGGILAIEGTLSVGTVVVFYFYIGRCLGPVRSIPGMVYAWHAARAARERMDEMFSIEAPPPLEFASNEPAPGPMTVSTRGLTFGYADGELALDGFDLEVSAGERVAILGPSGVGKSTAARHLLRLLEAEGEICLQEHLIERWSVEQLRRRVGFVGQEVFLFDGALRDNLTLGLVPTAGDDALRSALQTAQLTEFAAERQGLETEVGERGARLSGGQRKRVALARALLRRPDLLIVDQMATDLEEELNERIFRALREEGMTLIYFGHRVPAGLVPDRVYWMERGALRPYEPGLYEREAPVPERDHG